MPFKTVLCCRQKHENRKSAAQNVKQTKNNIHTTDETKKKKFFVVDWKLNLSMTTQAVDFVLNSLQNRTVNAPVT